MNYKSKWFTEQVSLVEALQSLSPNAAFGIINEDIDQIDWQSSDITQPSKAEILAEQTRLQEIRDAQFYKKKRALEYPSVEEQLDLLFHGGLEQWRESIQAIKDKYPKP